MNQPAIIKQISSTIEQAISKVSKNSILSRTLLLLGFVVVWFLVAEAGVLHTIILPSPGDVFLVAISETNVFLQALQVTLYEVIIGILLAWTIGISVGILLGATQFSRDVFRPVFAALFAVPFILLYPIFLAWFGIGSLSKILFGAAYGAYPIILNTMAGISSVEEKYIMAGRSMGASKIQIRSRILLPLAVPSIISGLRIGTALVVIGVVVTEMLASTKGLGFVIRSNQTMFKSGHVYLAIILALLIVVLVNQLLSALERRTQKWRQDRG